MEILQLSDNSIAQIAKAIQIAILTGTDVVDNLRQVRFNIVDGTIEIEEAYLKQFKANIDAMVEKANQDPKQMGLFE